MAKSQKKTREDDFITTISDSDSEVPDLDDDELEAEDSDRPVEVEEVKPAKKGKGPKANGQEPEFALDFDLGDFESVNAFSGWDFDMQDRAKGSGRRQVDLDGIIQRQRNKEQGLDDEGEDSDAEEDEEVEAPSRTKSKKISSAVQVDAEDDGSDKEEEKGDDAKDEDGDDDDDEEEVKVSSQDAEDKLAALKKLEKIQEPAKSKKASKKSAKPAAAVDDDESEESDNGMDVDPDLIDDDGNAGDSESEEEEKDTPKAIAKFFAAPVKPDPKKLAAHKQFHTLNISRPILRAIAALGYAAPTPVQSAVIPIALSGKDIVAGAVTGSGKTAAYMIPVLERLLYRPKKIASTRVVVLAPTRELAIQVSDVGRKLSQYVPGIRFGLAVGGLNLRVQEQELKSRPDIVVATPGRFIDHIRNSPSFQVDDVEILIIDEADRMLEEGFQKELTELLTLMPTRRQTLLFSATMNSSIKQLIQLSLHQPVRIMINPPKQAASGLVQEFIRIRKRESAKPAILTWLLKKFDNHERIMVFVSRKETAHRLRVILGLLGTKVGELHGALTQEQRLNGITDFRNSAVPILICTDLASRGLDIPKVEIVVNYDMPKSHEIYLHRVGRTARAGRTGRSISLVGEAKAERVIVKDAVKSLEKDKGKAVSRNVNWDEVNKVVKDIEGMEESIEAVLQEEKSEKQLAIAEMQLKKGENLIKHFDEIKSRPKRTWFDDSNEKSRKRRIRSNKA
ncbi:P-loop containing nucleoside triphosphate hydrolase protein [Myxozyma melibiosi]|uniref:RNA helicase n=1 Tax=Myxozyma melibiosi TaxID=54550 RepID=A0ABR1FE32_9ASCO